ncbi:hypothetical protein [Novosphingobium sp.]|uniref:hypothetical protein n=1 Tax=Novosphingobium sp. TaxID=1874826 RepID=UPI00286E1633|nr:hypothetical protein [Novosphingobium sp.]
MKSIVILAAASLVAASIGTPALAADAAPAATAAKYSSKTTPMSVLLGDPAAKAVLVKHVPQLVGNPDIAERAGGMTLSEIGDAIKAYSPDVLSEAVLVKIDADLAALPAR